MNELVKKQLKILNVSSNVIQGIDKLIEGNYLELEVDDKDMLKFKFFEDLADDFFCADLIDTNENINKYYTIDLMHKDMNNYYYIYNEGKDILKTLSYDKFDVNNYEHRRGVVCNVLNSINEYKYSRYKSIADLKESIPILVFLNLLDNEVETRKVYIETEYGKISGELQKIQIKQTMFGNVKYYAHIDMISKSKDFYIKKPYYARIYPKQSLVKSLEDFNIHLLTDDIYKELTERGRKYATITSKPNYCYYSGIGYSVGIFGDEVKEIIESRIMIDSNAFIYFNSDIDNNWTDNIFIYQDKNYYGEEVKEEDYWQCSPIVYGFNFTSKQWHKFIVDNISDIKFSDNAFNELIVPDNIKDLFIASITNDIPSLDSIAGKGVGKIFLLYGPPGVGKTYSAESIAEYLRKPLYYLSLGELGITPNELETSLERAMRIVERWDAILLLDEVDVFAIDRKNATIERNAMTAILLRTLERYNGIMFMTTNLIDNLDPAFISRATAVIKYEALSSITIFEIWSNLIDKIIQLNTINVSSTLKDDIKKLYDKYQFLIHFNGRAIKNVLRLAYALAISKKEELSIEHIEIAINGIKDFI